jgi:uncharacterized protein with HEPN domain
MKRSRNYRFDFFLDEMLAAMKHIDEYTHGITFEEFVGNAMIRDAVIRNFEVIGESVKHIPFSYQRKHGKLPWRYMLSLRNFIVHEFFDIDDEVLWEIIRTDLKKNILDLELIHMGRG